MDNPSESPQNSLKTLVEDVKNTSGTLEQLPYQEITDRINELRDAIVHLTHVVNGLKGGRPRLEAAQQPEQQKYIRDTAAYTIMEDGRIVYKNASNR